MKNLNKQNASLLSKRKLFLAAMGFIFSIQYGVCQKNSHIQNENVGLAVTSMITADGYGSQFSPMIYYKKDRRSYFIGPIIQKQKMNLSGVQFNYDYNIVGQDAPGNEAYNENLELFCFFSASYNNNALLGKRALWEEGMANSKYEGDVSKLHFQSVEVYAGAGLKIRLFKNIKWINCLGLGGYTSFNFPGNLYYNANNMGLILKTAISFDIKK